MQSAIAQFLRFLSVERNAAPLTIKSYREDLASLAEYLGQACGREPSPAEVTPLDLRGYVSALHEAGSVPFELAVVIALLAATLAGAIQGAFVAFMGLPSLVVTLAGLIGWRGAGRILVEDRSIGDFPEWF